MSNSKLSNREKYAVRKRHSLGNNSNYIKKTNMLLAQLDEAARDIALSITKKDELTAGNASAIQKINYFRRRLIIIKTILSGPETTQADQIKAEANLLFDKVQAILN